MLLFDTFEFKEILRTVQNKKIGILGGGQLGRMFIQSALNWDLEIHILDPDPQAPCHKLAHSFTCGSFNETEEVYCFGKNLDLLTIEIENVNVEALARLRDEGKEVYPQPEVIYTIKNKRRQKKFLQANHIPTADFVLTENREEVQQFAGFLPAFHKLGEGGYDGRGVQLINSPEDYHKAFDAPALLEKKVEIGKEISLIIARNARKEIAIFPPAEMVFHPTYHLVDYLFSPAHLPPGVLQQAEDIARKVITALDMTGLLAIEMFVTPQGQVLVNEMAPRPHNSGHQSIEGNETSQYEQHLRAILGLPLGSTKSRNFAAMVNLIGETGFEGKVKYEGLEELLQMPGVYAHIYGKKMTKPSRKMGHVTILSDTVEDLKEKVEKVKTLVKVVSR